MKCIFLFIIAMGLIEFQAAAGLEGCGFNLNYTLFNLCPFSDRAFIIYGDTNDTTLSFVTPATSPCDLKNNTQVYVKSVDVLDTSCMVLADSSPQYSLLDPSDPHKGISISFPATYHQVLMQNFTSTVTINLACDPNANEINATAFRITNSRLDQLLNQQLVISGSSSQACPVASFNKVVDFIAANGVVFTIVFCLIGLIIAFFGLKFFRVVVFCISFITVSLVLFFFLHGLTGNDVSSAIMWTLFSISLLGGLITGFISVKYPKVGYFLIGGCLGIVAGLILFASVISPFLTTNSGSAILAITLVIAAIIGGIIGIFWIESIIIIATSCIGGYMSIRVISLLLGGFPLESEIASGNKEFSGFTYLYIALMILVAGSGIYVQFKMKAKADEQKASFGDSDQTEEA